jgi:hypothetical protein
MTNAADVQKGLKLHNTSKHFLFALGDHISRGGSWCHYEDFQNCILARIPI